MGNECVDKMWKICIKNLNILFLFINQIMGSCVSTCDECNKKELERQEEMPCLTVFRKL